MSRNMNGVISIIGCSVAIFWPGALNFGFPGVMAPVWQDMFHVGRAATGAAIFFMLAAVGIFMFLVGRWQERYGTRRMIALGVIICSLNVILAAYASSMIMIYAWAFINGLSSCFVYIPALTTVQRWYPKKKGLVTGTVSMVFGLSAAITSPLFGMMLKSLGYVSMNFTVAIMALIISLVGAYFARAPEGEAFEKSASPGNEPSEKSLTVQESLHTRSFWFLWMVWALQGAAGIVMVTLSTSYGLSKGFSLESAILILTAFNLTNGFSRLISGYFSDTIGRNRIMSAAFFAAGFAYLLLYRADDLLSCAILVAVVGFSFGTLFAVSAPLITDCFGLKHFGAIFGLAFAAYGFIAAPLGPILSGYLLDITNDSFFLVFLYLAVFCMLSSLCVRLVVPPFRS